MGSSLLMVLPLIWTSQRRLELLMAPLWHARKGQGAAPNTHSLHEAPGLEGQSQALENQPQAFRVVSFFAT